MGSKERADKLDELIKARQARFEDVARRLQHESEMLRTYVIVAEESTHTSCDETIIQKDEVKKSDEALTAKMLEENASEEKRQRQANAETWPSLEVVGVASGAPTTPAAKTTRAGRCGCYEGLGDSRRISKKIKKGDAKRAELTKAREAFEETKCMLKEEAKRLEEGRDKAMTEVLPCKKYDEALEIKERRQRERRCQACEPNLGSRWCRN